MTPILAQAGGQSAATAVLTTLAILYVASLMFGMVRRPSFAGVFQLLVFLLIMWVGWSVRDWPTTQSGDGMLISFFKAWVDSLQSMIGWILEALGGTQVGQWFDKHFDPIQK